MAIGDFNRDGHLDAVYFGAFGTSGLYFLPGTASGLFGTPVLLRTGDPAGDAHVVTGDFNGDGKLDFAVTVTNGNSVSVFLGNGDGTFQAAVDYPAGPFPRTMVVADFNADGKPDLAVQNASSISIFLGNGDGTFMPKVDYLAGISTFAISFGDYNGDGILDLAVTDSWQCTNGVRLDPSTSCSATAMVRFKALSVLLACPGRERSHRVNLSTPPSKLADWDSLWGIMESTSWPPCRFLRRIRPDQAPPCQRSIRFLRLPPSSGVEAFC